MKYFEIKLSPSEKLSTFTVEAENLGPCYEEHAGRILSIRALPWEEFYSVPVLHDFFRVTLVDCMGDDLAPLRSARLSTGNATGADERKDDSLRDRLWRDKHTSPWETNIACFELTVPLFVLRQIDRHRTVDVSNTVIEDYDDFRKFTSRNEFSGRYSEMPDLYYLPKSERFQRKGSINKQGSAGALPPNLQLYYEKRVVEQTDRARALYDEMLRDGVASELARIILPQNQCTKIRLQATLNNWYRFLALRLAPDVQEETRLFANAIAGGLMRLWPKCYEAFLEHTLNAVTLSASERNVISIALRENVDLSTLKVHLTDAEYRRLIDKFDVGLPQD